MAPSKRRGALEHKPSAASRLRGPCACLQKPRNDGLCELNVWQGTTVDAAAARSGDRLLRPRLPVVKYRHWTLGGLSSGGGHLYHLVILSWPQLLALFVASYILVVSVFALLFAGCNGIDYPNHHAEVRYYFNLSLQTLGTIGYGYLFPRDACSNWVAVVEAFVSMLLTAFMTGVAFVKFARPHPSIIFSKVFTVSERESGGLEMRFRVVNGTRREVISQGEILEVGFKLILMRVEDTNTGEKKLCYYDLRLKTSNFITLRLEAELVHHVDEGSPFFGLTESQLRRSDFVLILMMAGVDQNLHDMIHKQHEYDHEAMRWSTTFASMMNWNPQHKCMDLDFDKVSLVVPDASDRADYTRIDMEASTKTASATSGDQDAEVRAWNIEGSDHETDLNQLHFEPALPPSRDPSASPDREQTPATASPADTSDSDASDTSEPDGEVDEEASKSEMSTKTNSDSETIENEGPPPVQRVRFDRRSRSTIIQMPRLARRARNHEFPESSFDQPASVLHRRIRFRNHPMSRFSKGLYYRALETPWQRLFPWLVIVYFASISVIALLLYITPGSAVLQTSDDLAITEFERLFFFCAQTISTIGYGVLSPNPDSNLVNFFVFVLVFAGVVVSTLLTGLAWAKFSIPKASSVVFSDNLLLTAFHGTRALVFRVANNRTFGMIIEGSFRVSVVILNRRFERRETHELKLVRNVWPIVQLGTTVTHIIDEDSPLHRCSTDDLLSGRYFFVVLFAGLDSVIVENMFARKTYHSCDILVGHHFVDNIKLAADGLHIDLEAINDTQFTPDIDLRESKLYVSTGSPRTEQPVLDTAEPRTDLNDEDDVAAENACGSPTGDYKALREGESRRFWDRRLARR